MNLSKVKKGLYPALLLSILTSSAFATQSALMAPAATDAPGKFYLGIFGGEGSSNQFHVGQFGTAFFTEAAGGPLSVNALGHTNSRSSWLVGAQAGYKAQDIMLTPSSPEWSLTPAIELEGYYFGKRSFEGNLVNNNAERLPEHNFTVTYPTKSSVFVANAVLSLNHSCFLFHPYIGAGFGGAIVKIAGADSMQTNPSEVGINHYNSDNSDTAPTFAGQVKAGLSYDINNYVSVFAEYRWLYLSSTHFTFGSTVYPGHAETSSWQVKLDPERYNMGTIGLRFSL